MQTSDKKLSTAKETSLYIQLVTLLSDIDHPKAMSSFLSLFLTDTERSVLSKRLQIVWLLYQGKSYEEIQKEIHVSSATISSMSELVSQPAVKEAMNTIAHDKKLSAFFEKL